MHAVVLKYFLEVARHGSIRKAAQNLFVASSAVNRQILRLEEELGTELFDRVPSGMRLNAAGERLQQHVRGTLHDFHLMRTELDALKGERKGHVSVAAMDSLLIEFLPAAVEEFSSSYPAVRYTIQSAMPSDVQRFHAAALQVTEWGTQRDACSCSVVSSTVSARACELERHVTETCVPVASW